MTVIPLLGKLDEIPLTELLASLARERCSGILRLARGAQRAFLSFRDGKAISARAPGVPRLGDLLAQGELCDPISVRGAARIQAEEQGQRPLGEILVANGVLTPAQLDDAIAQQIHLALTELRDWKSGRFQFDLEVASAPVMVEHGVPSLRSATASGSRPSRPERATRSRRGTTARAALAPPGAVRSTEGRLAPAVRTLEVLTADRAWYDELVSRLPADLVRPVQVSFREALVGTAGTASLLLADLRDETRDPAELGQLKGRRGNVPVLAVIPAESPSSAIYAAGAIAVLPAEPRAVVAAIANLLEALGEMGAPPPAPAREEPPRRLLDFEEEDLLEVVLPPPREASATVELDLLRAVSEEVDRAILFLVTAEALQAVGAFGSSADGSSLAALTRGFAVPFDDRSDLVACVLDQTTRCLLFEVAKLPPKLVQILGPPQAGQSLILPISGGETPVAVIYADNGEVPEPITDLGRLQLTAARFGPALETELLIREAARTLG